MYTLPTVVAKEPSVSRTKVLEFAEALVGHDAPSSPERTPDSGFGTRTAHGVDEYTTAAER